MFNINRNAFEVGVFLAQVMEGWRNVENLVVALQQASFFFFSIPAQSVNRDQWVTEQLVLGHNKKSIITEDKWEYLQM